MTEPILVAPRELHDLVYRCARIAGCDAGSADMIGRAVTFGQIHDHRAAEAFIELDGPAEIATVATAFREIAIGEAQARRTGEAVELNFDPPIPDALTAFARFESARRGAETVDLGHDDGRLSTLVLGPAAPIDALARAHAERQARFERTGLPLAREAFDELAAQAKGFLVAESILDELEDS